MPLPIRTLLGPPTLRRRLGKIPYARAVFHESVKIRTGSARVRTWSEGLPDDPALPGLRAIRTIGLADALPELKLGDVGFAFRLCNHVEGSRATFEVRAEGRRFAIKLYSESPTPEVQLYRRFHRIGFAGDSGTRAPRLMAFNPDLQLLAISWLDGKPLNTLIREGRGDRAGQLAASCFGQVSRLRVKLGPPCGSGRMLYNAGMAVVGLASADPGLGAAAKAVARTLVRRPPREGRRQLVHGTLYARHLLDLGDGCGVIDWQQFGQGPAEADVGMFLASLTRIRLKHESLAEEVGRAEEALLSGTDTLVDERTLDWYWAAGLLHMAASGLKGGRERVARPEARGMIREAARHAEPTVASGVKGARTVLPSRTPAGGARDSPAG